MVRVLVRVWITLATFTMVATHALAPRALAAEPEAADRARAALQMADQAMGAKDYPAAAKAMEEAYGHDPNPLWLANAGYARMMAGELERAIAHFTKALSDDRLRDDTRDKTVDRLTRAERARANLALADEAIGRGDYAMAARAHDDAVSEVDSAFLLLGAAALWERAGGLATSPSLAVSSLDAAQARYQSAATRDDLTPSQRRAVAEALPRIASMRVLESEPPLEEPPVSPPASSSDTATAGWVLLATGLVATGVGITGFVLSAADERSFRDAERNERGELLMARETAAELEASATTWLNVGMVGSIVGGAALVTGVVLLLVHDAPTTRGDVHVSGSLQPGGGFISAVGRF